MDNRLKDLYHIPEKVLPSRPQDIYLEDLALQCTHAEERLRNMMTELSTKHRQIVEEYINLRDELEFQTVKQAMRFSKYVK